MSEANFTPSREPQVELKPFQFWCQKVLPLVYDDSLSYYELLCKVVNYLNKTMEDVSNMDTDMSNVYTAYSELESYVNEYFNNLDVQEEINNKLDSMASSGLLFTLFGKFFINIYDTFNDVPKNIPNITYFVKGRNKIFDKGGGTWCTTLNEPQQGNYYEKYGEVYHVLIDYPTNIISIGCVDENNNIDVDKLNSTKINGGLYIPSGIYHADKTISPLFSIYGTTLSTPNINHETAEIGSWRERSNAIIMSTADTIIQVNDGCKIENIIVVGNSYKQTENRELARQGNNQPIYSRYKTGEQIGIYLHDYGSYASNCYAYFCQTGIKCDYYAICSECYSFECEIGLYVNANDNNIYNFRGYDCKIGVFISGSLNMLTNIRCDGISEKGCIVQSNGNDIVNLTVDFSYQCALYIKGNHNTVTNIKMRCCAQYPNIETEVSTDNYLSNCGICINGISNLLKNIQGYRASIMDSGDDVISMKYFVGIYSGSTLTFLEFLPESSRNVKQNELAICIDGNAPATRIIAIDNLYSNSFTKIDNENVLTTNGLCNTKEVNPRKGSFYTDGTDTFIHNGNEWIKL